MSFELFRSGKTVRYRITLDYRLVQTNPALRRDSAGDGPLLAGNPPRCALMPSCNSLECNEIRGSSLLNFQTR